MGFQKGRVDHDGLDIVALGSQHHEDTRKDPQPAPAHPSVVKSLQRTIGRRRIPPAQPVAIDEDYPAQLPPIINPRHPMRQREVWLGVPSAPQSTRTDHSCDTPFGAKTESGRDGWRKQFNRS